MAFEKLFASIESKLSAEQLKYLEDILNPNKMAKPSLIIDGVGFLGKATILEDLPTEYNLALQRINVTVDQNSVMRAYSRIERLVACAEDVDCDEAGFVGASKMDGHVVTLNTFSAILSGLAICGAVRNTKVEAQIAFFNYLV
ncbi:hypothetical protein KQX54_012782 [Cotesia glomerata]|uniref:Uncharacterized protein n=1 Tax=Cotesia glomerata TaxID=32391 RepID=A0AAV7I7I1_COTGL|nr:hypothetical protein KQX54_012782 [Cotesia glomerata]